MKTARPAQNHSDNRADSRLQYPERKLCHSHCGRRVDKSSVERVADNHYNSAERHTDTRSEFRVFFKNVMEKNGDNDRLKSMCYKGNEHRGRIKKQVSEKRADTADHKRRDRIEQYRRKADNDIVKIQMSAGNGNAERAQSDVHRHKDCGGA